ncbi:MAG TPA: hypothetical protein VFA34_10350 [Actinomycetota bacterium]|nr:hypothetical protein [Actinomycetota bacterium]
MTNDRLSTSALDDILSRAVDRQIAEQRALRQSLDELREAVNELAARPGPKLDVSALEERLQTIVRALSERPAGGGIDTVGLEERLKGIIQSTVMGASETTFSSLSDQLRSFRESVVPKLEQADDASAGVRGLSAEIAQVRDVVVGVSGDLEGIAQALIDFNAGIRQWAVGMDDAVASVKLTVGELYAVATQPTKTREPEKEKKEEAPADEESEPKRKEPAPEVDGRRSAEIADRIKETAELSEYLADQIEDLDGVMGRLTELPQQLEGVVSQALKRTLTARAKLDKEAEGALDEVLEALDQQVAALGEVLSRFEQEEDHMRKLALEQVELSSRIESLQETFIDRIERIDTDRRRSDEAIAVAIDRSARGLQPRALESLTKSTKQRKPAPQKQQKAKTASRKAAAKAEPAPEPARSKPKRSRRRSKQLDWTPLPSDE